MKIKWGWIVIRSKSCGHDTTRISWGAGPFVYHIPDVLYDKSQIAAIVIYSPTSHIMQTNCCFSSFISLRQYCWEIDRASQGPTALQADRLLLLPSSERDTDWQSLCPCRSDCPRSKHWDFPPASGGALRARRLLVPVRRLELCRHHQEPESLRPHRLWVSRRGGVGEGKRSLHHLGERFWFPPTAFCIFCSFSCVLTFRPS